MKPSCEFAWGWRVWCPEADCFDWQLCSVCACRHYRPLLSLWFSLRALTDPLEVSHHTCVSFPTRLTALRSLWNSNSSSLLQESVPVTALVLYLNVKRSLSSVCLSFDRQRAVRLVEVCQGTTPWSQAPDADTDHSWNWYGHQHNDKYLSVVFVSECLMCPCVCVLVLTDLVNSMHMLREKYSIKSHCSCTGKQNALLNKLPSTNGVSQVCVCVCVYLHNKCCLLITAVFY